MISDRLDSRLLLEKGNVSWQDRSGTRNFLKIARTLQNNASRCAGCFEPLWFRGDRGELYSLSLSLEPPSVVWVKGKPGVYVFLQVQLFAELCISYRLTQLHYICHGNAEGFMVVNGSEEASFVFLPFLARL